MTTQQTNTRAADAALSFSSNTKGLIVTFTTHNSENLDPTGTFFQGYLDASYEELCDLFGEPIHMPHGKSEAQWLVRFDGDGVLATIYNWKDSRSYLGPVGKDVKAVTNWHIGGFDKAVVERVQIAMDLHREVRDAERPKDKMEEAFSSAQQIMESITAMKGRNYGHAIEGSMLLRKHHDLLSLLLTPLIETEIMPKDVAKQITAISADLTARVMAKLARLAGVGDTIDEARELMNWVEQMQKAESAGAKSLIEELMKKDGDE